jgi:nitrate/TMAO reductase-like tetraheme cytochrome c subunit
MATEKSPRKRFNWRWPSVSIDLSKSRDRWKVLVWGGVLLIVGLILLAGGVSGYQYSESSVFCGTTCHSMQPQWVRYQRSPHSNVRCADCHVGPGAASFVQSKIDGAHQIIAEITGDYPRPIESPIENLRPARETCEECHSPTTFKDNIVKINHHFKSDAKNTPVLNTLVLKMGGTQEATGMSDGIHWHVSSKVYYIAADKKRQVIQWVGVEQPDGTLKEYFGRDMLGMSQTSFVEEARAKGEVREMDCIDCHNRAAHFIPSSTESVDNAMEDGTISRDMPYIHAKAIELLDTTYADQKEAFAAIDQLSDEYQGKASEDDIEQAIETIKSIYLTTNFPDMALDWTVNPNNQDHTPFLGCFRCHDGNHILAGTELANEETISVECNLCHTVPITGSGEEMLVEAPVIVGAVPESHADYSWTIQHRYVTDADKQACYQCHGQGFCNNGACHNLEHPEDMAFTHANEVKRLGSPQVCYTCHQNVTCTRCHPSGIGKTP